MLPQKSDGEAQIMTILLADDDKNILTLLTAVLQSDGFKVIAAKDGAEALDLYYDNHVDMLICDEMMPQLSGNELVREIRVDNKELPIIMVTAKGATADKGKSFDCGVDDYMVKPLNCDELLMRVRALFRRAKINTEKKIVAGNTVLDSNAHTITNNSTNLTVTLTKTEFDILYKLLLYPDKVFSKWQLFHEFWGIDSEVDDGIVKVFISKIRKQIEPFPETSIRTVMGIGYQGVKNDC